MEERVQKIIANSGFCSRRKAEELIQKGKVKVNDKLITIGDKADSHKDIITVDGKKIVQERKTYLLLHKPIKCVTTMRDPDGNKTVMDYVKTKEKVKPVGRLDVMTEGALILTNDGDFAQKVAHPSFKVSKVYRIHLDKPLSEEDERKIANGLHLEDGHTGKIDIKIFNFERTLVSLKIHIGKNRIIRRIFNHLGYPIKKLIRVQIGPVKLDDMPPKKYRPLTRTEIDYFLKK